MKLSMWTICDWLEQQGMSPQPQISEGQPLIEGVKLHIPLEPAGDNVEVLTAEGLSAGEGYSTILRFQEDQILLAKVGLAVVHNQVLECFRFYQNWEKKLLLCMLDGKSLQDLLEVAHEVFKRPMFIKSDSSWVYAITKGYDDDVHPDWARLQESVISRQADFNAVKAVSLDPDYQVTFTQKYPAVRNSPFYGGEVLHANVWLKDHRICEIITIDHGRPFNPGDPHLLNFFVQVVHRVIQADTPLYLSYSGLSAFFADMLETDSYDQLNINAVLHTLNWREADELVVLCVAIQASYNTPILSVLREKLVAEFSHGCAFSYQGHVICIANTTKAGGVEEVIKLAAELIPRETFTWGVSYEFCGMEHFPAYYRQAHLVLSLAQENRQPFYTMQQTALTVLAHQIERLPDAGTYIHPDIRRLRALDQAGDSHYANTLFQYLLCGGNFTDTANSLGLHRNSLIYRVNRIREVISSDLDSAQDRKLLLLSFLFDTAAL